MTSPDELTALVAKFVRSLPPDCGAMVVAGGEGCPCIVNWVRIHPKTVLEAINEAMLHMDEDDNSEEYET